LIIKNATLIKKRKVPLRIQTIYNRVLTNPEPKNSKEPIPPKTHMKPKSQKTVEATVEHPILPRKHPNPTKPPKPTRNLEQPSQKNTNKPKTHERHPNPEPTEAEIKSRPKIERKCQRYRGKKTAKTVARRGTS